MISPIGALRRPLQAAVKDFPSRVQLRTPHASFGFGPLRTLRSTSHPQKAAIFSSAFSTRATYSNHTQDKRKSDTNYWGSKSMGTPLAMSFESLGIRKNTQLFIMLILAVGAVLETLLWGEKAWLWWKGEEGDRLE
ncbi:hypothetical protein N7481_007517 [Penicillium waksmanii]|uniref:uncharacterized protein n=1 Tax=Penicillium waksmanii TaxID=69791 RepID=UPI002546774C|nr:uncharacterized protein N7481_007517 [Penicillium waksmanii]KAJ5980219.1 hypothetical protein N7481_007517 [Penicillium waksmanii]